MIDWFTRDEQTLRNHVVVITGASSGIGRATALAFASCGCRLVLAARRIDPLREVTAKCTAAGGAAIPVEADVTNEADIDRLLAESLAHFGRIDVWVNNAGTTLFAALDQGSFAAHRRVLETNLLAPMYCARMTLPIFARQRAGVMINVGSVLSQVGQPFVPSYVISKFGLRGLTDALRAEVADLPNVHVCTVMPFAVDTPHFESGGNEVGRAAHAMPPAQTPEAVAKAIVELAVHPRRQRYVPRYMALGVAAHWLAPRFTERVLGHVLARYHFGGPQRRTDGALFAPLNAGGRTTGTRPPTAATAEVVTWAVTDAFRTLAQSAADTFRDGWSGLRRRRRRGGP